METCPSCGQAMIGETGFCKRCGMTTIHNAQNKMFHWNDYY